MMTAYRPRQFICALALANLLLADLCAAYFYTSAPQQNDNKHCFCELKGNIDDCSCTVDTVDYFNNMKIYPRLKSLLVKDYFRFYRVNLKHECPFWADDSKCAMKFCNVQPCDDNDIPVGLRTHSSADEPVAYKYTEEAQAYDCNYDLNVELGYLNTSISEKAHNDFQRWADYDETQDNFCVLDDHQEEAAYVDLLLNPERYTGYKGESAHRVWRSIYMENCFAFGKKRTASLVPFMVYKDWSQRGDVCMEQRAFYRIVSGLHASINIHLSANYLLSEKKGFMSDAGIWGPNPEELYQRFSPETTNNEGEYWLRNLYFAYIVELRALAKAAAYLRTEPYFTGVEEDDSEVQQGVADFLNVIETFPSHFNESAMFSGGLASLKLKQEFREKFRNISKIMDCVGCDKCRLWGKLQVQGLGTALKILFSGKFDDDQKRAINGIEMPFALKLRRSEIVALFNAFGRLSTSIHELEKFRQTRR